MRRDFYHWLYEALDLAPTLISPKPSVSSSTGSFHGAGQSPQLAQARQAILDKLQQIEKSRKDYKGNVEGQPEHIFGDDPTFLSGGPGSTVSGLSKAMSPSQLADFQRAMQARRPQAPPGASRR